MPEPTIPAPDTIRAPWTFEQVEALDRFQHHGGMHPFTCGGGHHGHRSPVLNATQTGWTCPDPTCDYQQDWALAFMANPDAWPKPLLGRTTTPAPPPAPATPAPSAGRDTMREAIAGALRAAAYHCDGDCGLDEAACVAAHLIQVDAWAHGVVSDISGPVDALTDAVMAALGAGNLERAACERYADAIDTVFEQWTTGLGETRPQDALTDAVLAVRDSEMEQLRGQLAQVEDLLRIAHDTSNRSEAERARAVRRAAEAEAKLAAARRDGAHEAVAMLRRTSRDSRDYPAVLTGARVIEDWLDTALAAPTGPDGQGDGGGK